MVQNITLDTKIVVSKDQASADLEDEAVVLNLKSGLYYELDSFSARVWKLIQEPRRVREIRDMLSESCHLDGNRCEKDLMFLLMDFARSGLIDIVSIQ